MQHLIKFSFLTFLSFFTLTCEKQPSLSQLNLIDHDKVLYETRYAVIKPSILRMKQEPFSSSDGVLTLRQYDVVKVILLVNQTGGWCRAEHQSTEGWVPVDDLQLFRTLGEASSYLSALPHLTDIKP